MATQQELHAQLLELGKQYVALKTKKSDLLKTIAGETAAMAKPEFTAAINANKAIKAQLDTLLREVNLKQILASLS